VRWYTKLPFDGIFIQQYFFTTNYWNRTTIVEIIVGGWVVCLFETQCSNAMRPKTEVIITIHQYERVIVDCDNPGMVTLLCMPKVSVSYVVFIITQRSLW